MSSVYALGDPRTSEIYYIGIAQDVYRRYAQHINYPHRNGQKNAWMEDLKEAGMVPTLLILETDPDNIYDRERYWIQHYLNLEMPLTNITDIQPQKVEKPIKIEGSTEEPIKVPTVIRLRVKEIADQKGISQAKVSRMSDVNITTVRRIYQHPTEANVTLETLIRLAKALDVSVRDLIDEFNEE
jgi:DNA-binding Xre family transcriptional regulator